MKCLSLKKYLDETSLHGFGYSNDKNKLFAAFWALLTVTCVYYTVHDIIAAAQLYQSVPTDVTVSAVPNLNAILPTPTLCMEIMLEKPESNFTIDDIKVEIADFMSATNNGADMNINNSAMQLSDTLEYLTYLMLGYITDFELLYTGNKKQIYTDYVNKYNETDEMQDTVSAPSATSFEYLIQKVYDAYMAHKVSLSNLKRLVGMSICKKQIETARYGSLLVGNKSLLVESICQADTVTHLSFSLLCIRLFKDSTYTMTSGLTVSLEGLKSASQIPIPRIVRAIKCQEKLPPQPSKMREVPVKFLWYVDLQGRSVIPNPPLRDIFIVDPALPASKFDVSVSTEYDFYSVPSFPERTCSPDTRKHECIGQKKAELTSQTCGCWPSTFLGVANTNNMATCSDNPNNLSQNVLSNSTYLKCATVRDANVSGLCNSDCTAYLHSISLTEAAPTVDLSVLDQPQDYQGFQLATTGSLEINFQSGFLRTLIVESPTTPFTTFLCQFGGIIGTYMGGSILAFVHIPIFILAQLTDCLTNRKKAKVADSEKTEEKINDPPKEQIYPPVQAEAKGV